MARTLETILLGRDLLSPVYTKAAASTRAYEQAVTGSLTRVSAAMGASAQAQAAAAGRAGGSAEAGARTQTAASGQIIGANTRAAEAAAASATAQSRAHARAAESMTVSARAQQAAISGLTASNGLLGTSMSPLTAGLGAVALGFGYAAFRGAAFESAMSQVQAATMATGSVLGDLRDLAIEAGAATQYSSEEAAQGITELAKAGVSTADILNGGLAGALDLAAAGQLEVGQAAEIAATQMVVFGLAGDQVSHVADLMAAGAGKAQGSVQDMALAMQYAGLPAAGLGLSIEETAGTLGLFASNGLVGEKAGTSFRGMLVSMTNPVGKTRELMDDLNLSFFDGQGQFIGMEGVAGQLQQRLGDLTVEQRNAALAQIFGNEALGAAQALYGGGAAGVELWTSNVNDAGYAAEQAGILNDNLRGDLEKLGGAFDSTMTVVGGFTQGTLRFLVQGLTDLIDVGGDVVTWIADLPGPLQAAAAAVVAMYLATGPLSGVLLTAGSNMAGLAGRALGSVSSVSALTGSLVAARTAAIGLVTAAVPLAIVAGLAYAVTELVAFSNAGDDATASVKRMNDAIDDADGNTERFGNVTGSLDEVRDKINELSPVVESWSEENRSWFERAFIPVTSGVEDARQSLEVYQDALDDLEDKQERNGQNVEVLGRRYDLTRSQVEDFADAHGIDLSGSLQIVQTDFMRLAEASGMAATSMGVASGSAATGYESFTAYAAALGLADEAAEDLRKRTDELGESLGEFISPLGAYTGLLDSKKEAERQSAQATADATADQSDSWEDYVGDVTVSAQEYLQILRDQVTAQDEWQTNMLILASRVSQGTIDELARMGPEGAQLVADMVDFTDAELAEAEGVFAQRAANATGAWGLTLQQAQPVLSQIAATAGQGVADSLAAQLAAGTTTIAAIAAQYGIVLADGVNPVLRSLGRDAVIAAAPRAVPGTGGRHADGGPIWGAGTATSDSIPAWLSNGEYVLKASSVARNGVSALNDLNEGRASVSRFATGGFASVGAVPKPRSTAPFAPPLSSGADATMQAGYDAVAAWLGANLEQPPAAASGGSANGLLPIMAAARAYVAETYGVRNIGGFARRNIAGTNTLSDHALGKAIDVMTSDKTLGWAIANDLAFGAAKSRFNIENVIWQQSISSRGGPFKRMADRGSPTQNHYDHVHADTFANGGYVGPGSILNPHVRDQGGPLLPGYTYNGLSRPEWVLSMASGGMVRAEDGSMVPESFYSRTAGPSEGTLLSSAQRRIAAGQALTEAQAAAISRALNPQTMPGYGASSTPVVVVNNYIDGKQFRSMATEVTNGRLEDIYRSKVYS
ncbi:phage tail tape measure protein [Modestobacter sp. Leaf380]|uniref:phage tail tape measure protein n=1 Tax=Modestobacter sp. Leaf380 TaxID=1736356 RepID=UPI0006F3DD64|nr:phage tail tape measure protein [Modestobacter sp. Leaf380]KQS66246.1 hypothetical protein ASG41_13055 [Modestobacter sp. Leaf380]